MRIRYKAPIEGTYFVTSTIVKWKKLFAKAYFADIIIKELNFRRERKEIELYGYVIMPEHFYQKRVAPTELWFYIIKLVTNGSLLRSYGFI